MDAAPNFDTMVARENLEKAGIPDKHADAITATIRDSQAQLATKADIREIMASLNHIKDSIDQIKDNMATKTDIAVTKADIERTKVWLMGTIVAVVGGGILLLDRLIGLPSP